MPDPIWFRLVLREDVARKMNRQQYKAAMSWLRKCARIMREQMEGAHA